MLMTITVNRAKATNVLCASKFSKTLIFRKKNRNGGIPELTSNTMLIKKFLKNLITLKLEVINKLLITV